MPNVLQGNIYNDYNFGPGIGAELSGCRPAPIISNDGFNSSREYGTAIAIPTSTSMPTEVHSRQHFRPDRAPRRRGSGPTASHLSPWQGFVATREPLLGTAAGFPPLTMLFRDDLGHWWGL